jgi:hypothetical protein
LLANAVGQIRTFRLKHCVRQQAGSYRVLRGIRGIADPKAARTSLRFFAITTAVEIAGSAAAAAAVKAAVTITAAIYQYTSRR